MFLIALDATHLHIELAPLCSYSESIPVKMYNADSVAVGLQLDATRS